MKHYKIIIILGIFIFIALMIFIYINNTSITVPQTVTINAGNQLTCTKLSTPKEIPPLEATYSCEAPGAYLESINLDKNEAQYFTSDSQGTKVTYGPEAVQIISAN